MMYENIRGYIRKKPLKIRHTVKELVDRKVTKFTDVIRLYIDVMWVLQDMWETKLIVLEWHRRNMEENTFNKKAFDKMLLEKWSLMTNENILKNVILKVASYLEWFMEQFLISEPEWVCFREFDINNFSDVDKVFNHEYMDDEDYLFSYKYNGKTKYIKGWNDYIGANIDECSTIMNSFDMNVEVRKYLNELSQLSFWAFKKHLYDAVINYANGYDVIDNNEFMTKLWNDLNRFREDKVREQKEELKKQYINEWRELERNENDNKKNNKKK